MVNKKGTLLWDNNPLNFCLLEILIFTLFINSTRFYRVKIISVPFLANIFKIKIRDIKRIG